MKVMKQVRLGGLCLTLLCMMAVFGFGAVGSASARPILLFLPTSEKFPYHLVGTGGASKLETVKGGATGTVTSSQNHVLALILNSTLFNLRIEFLKATTPLGGHCENGATQGVIVVQLLGHLGLIDPGLEPGVLLLVPSGFKFTCTVLGQTQELLVRGSVIGLATSPKVGELSELLAVKFEQAKGQQKWTLFLLGNELLTKQFQETSLTHEESGFEHSGQEGEATLHALPGQGTFKIILDP